MKITLALMLALTVGASASPGAQTPAGAAGEAPQIDVHRVKTCGCCSKWMDHLKESGMAVTDHIRETREGAPGRDQIPETMRSCHTAAVGGYVIEGHVPADVIKQLLKERPTNIVGLSVPGMPAGSPGMESPNPVAYDVMAIHKDGSTSVYKRIPANR